MPGYPIEGGLNSYWDPNPESTPIDCGWIWEDENGIGANQAPAAMISQYPALWGPVAEWQAGLRELGRAEWEALSSYEYEAKMAMISAHVRALKRPTPPPSEVKDGSNR